MEHKDITRLARVLFRGEDAYQSNITAYQRTAGNMMAVEISWIIATNMADILT